MLRQVFGEAPEVFQCFAETFFFANLDDIRRVFRPISDPGVRRELAHYVARIVHQLVPPGITPVEERRLDDAGADEIAAIDTDHVGTFVATLDYLTAEAGRKRWLEKTPPHIYDVDTIKATIPDACFVEIIRSPLDALASKKTREEIANANRGADGRPRVDRFFHPVWDAISWRASVRAGAALLRNHPDASVRVRYEDVVAAPEKVFRALCERANVTFVPAMLSIRRRNAVGAGPKESGISPLSVERWREVLTPGEVAIIHLIVGRTAKAVGYDVPRGRVDRSAARWLLFTTVEPIERLVKHARRTGWRSALSALGRYAGRMRPRRT
jgi:hypothetical protein